MSNEAQTIMAIAIGIAIIGGLVGAVGLVQNNQDNQAKIACAQSGGDIILSPTSWQCIHGGDLKQ